MATLKEQIKEALANPKAKVPKHWLGAEIPYGIYEGLIEYAKIHKITVGQLILEAFACLFCGIQTGEATKLKKKGKAHTATLEIEAKEAIKDGGKASLSEPPTTEDLKEAAEIGQQH